MRLIALALLLAAPALAQPIEITGTDMVTLRWAPATGPVVGYLSKVAYLDGTEGLPVFTAEPAITVTPRRGIPWRLLTQSCRLADTGLKVCDGPWAEPSNAFVLCPLKPDVDCDLAVGMSDYGLVVDDWGKRVPAESDQ
jgi:hypothetical protein